MSTLTAQDFTIIASGLDHPEDIVWDQWTQTLYAGSEDGVVYAGQLNGEWRPLVELGKGQLILGMALDAAGRIYVCNAGGHRLDLVDPSTGTWRVLSTGCEKRSMITPNYPAFDDAGRLYVSDSGNWGSDNGVIYAIDPSSGGNANVWDSRLPHFTNGIALSPDGKWLYVAESIASRVSRIEILSDGTPGQIEHVWSASNTVPDGLAFDAAGFLYISCYTPDSIYRLSPDGAWDLFAHDWSGQRLQAPTNIAFIGPSLQTLATANLCGWHLNATDSVQHPGFPLRRPHRD